MDQIVGESAIEPQDDKRATFEALAREQLPRLYGLARRLTNDGAEDLVQECLLKAYRSYGGLQATEAGPAWLQQILLNAFRDRLRNQARRVEEVRRDFVVNVSHELKTPVGGLALLAEAVLDARDDPEAVARRRMM